MIAFPEPVMKKLEALARAGDALSTDHARIVLGLTAQQYQRMALQPDFPRRQHIGRKFWLNPQALLDFAVRWNRLSRGLTITQVATVIHAAITTARRLAKSPGFPNPVGDLNGRERWDRDEIVSWHRTRVGGAKLSADFDAGPDKSPKRKALAKGAHNGKSKNAKSRAEA